MYRDHVYASSIVFSCEFGIMRASRTPPRTKASYHPSRGARRETHFEKTDDRLWYVDARGYLDRRGRDRIRGSVIKISLSAPRIPHILTPSTVAFRCGLINVCVYVCIGACARAWAIFIITHSAQSLLRRHSGLSDRAFTPSNSYGTASAGRDIYLNGSKTSPSLVPAELNINDGERILWRIRLDTR